MSPEVFVALLVFAFVTSVTPGPNNLMLRASGVNFGFRRTVPHMLGSGMAFSCPARRRLRPGALIESVPLLHTALKFGGAVYLVYLAWKTPSHGQSAKL